MYYGAALWCFPRSLVTGRDVIIGGRGCAYFCPSVPVAKVAECPQGWYRVAHCGPGVCLDSRCSILRGARCTRRRPLLPNTTNSLPSLPCPHCPTAPPHPTLPTPYPPWTPPCKLHPGTPAAPFFNLLRRCGSLRGFLLSCPCHCRRLCSYKAVASRQPLGLQSRAQARLSLDCTRRKRPVWPEPSRHCTPPRSVLCGAPRHRRSLRVESLHWSPLLFFQSHQPWSFCPLSLLQTYKRLRKAGLCRHDSHSFSGRASSCAHTNSRHPRPRPRPRPREKKATTTLLCFVNALAPSASRGSCRLLRNESTQPRPPLHFSLFRVCASAENGPALVPSHSPPRPPLGTEVKAQMPRSSFSDNPLLRVSRPVSACSRCKTLWRKGALLCPLAGR